MNAYVERMIGTIRREALDHFILVSESQIRNVVSEYIDYYDRLQPHQGIGKIPRRAIQADKGKILKMPILSGLHHHYYRSSA